MEVLFSFSAHKSVSQRANQRVFDPGDLLCGPQDDPHITWPIKAVYLRHHATSDSIKGVSYFSDPKGIRPAETYNIKGWSHFDLNVFDRLHTDQYFIFFLYKEIIQNLQVNME